MDSTSFLSHSLRPHRLTASKSSISDVIVNSSSLTSMSSVDSVISSNDGLSKACFVLHLMISKLLVWDVREN